jgi:hypothetical protein
MPLKIKDRSSNLSGIMVASSAPMVSHLLFADDSMLFSKLIGTVRVK